MTEKQKEQTLGKIKKGSHSSSVLSLDWNKLNDCNLFSGSADQTIKIWDLNKLNCINTLKYHSNKVQEVVLKISDPNVLLSGGFDKQIFLFDIKKKYKEKQLKKYNVDGEIETLKWHPLNENLFIATLENGYIECFDTERR